jgi:hypothetical protein
MTKTRATYNGEPVPLWGTSKTVYDLYGVTNPWLHEMCDNGHVRRRKRDQPRSRSNAVYCIADVDAYLNKVDAGELGKFEATKRRPALIILSQRLRRWRTTNGYSQTEVAEMIDGAGLSDVSHWESGTGGPNHVRVERLAEMMRLQVCQLFYDGEDCPYPNGDGCPYS